MFSLLNTKDKCARDFTGAGQLACAVAPLLDSLSLVPGGVAHSLKQQWDAGGSEQNCWHQKEKKNKEEVNGEKCIQLFSLQTKWTDISLLNQINKVGLCPRSLGKPGGGAQGDEGLLGGPR